MKRNIKKHGGSVGAIIGLMVVALGVGFYIVQNQRLRLPLLEQAPMKMEVELPEANAVTPGQGQTVQVAGVNIGRISKVSLEEGRAIVGVDIEPEYDDLIKTDARALLRPRTALKDMYIQVMPGSERAPLAEEGFRIPVSNTLTDVELHDILEELGPRTQEYIRLLFQGTGEGLDGNGDRLAEVFKRFEPTFRDLSRVNRAVAQERRALRRLITSLAELNGRLAEDPEDLTELVDTAAATFGAFASEDDDLRSTVTELAPTLRQARTTLRNLRPFARELGPSTRSLIPVFQELEEANRRVQPFAREAAPILRDRIRPFVRESRPLTADLRRAATSLSATFPEVTRAGRVFNRFLNMLSFNENGAQPPEQTGRDEGFLFWLGWLGHQSVYLNNIEDANGPLRPLFLTGTCGSLSSLVFGEPALEFGLNLSPVLATACGNPKTPSVDAGQLTQLFPQVAPLLPRAKKEAGR